MALSASAEEHGKVGETARALCAGIGLYHIGATDHAGNLPHHRNALGRLARHLDEADRLLSRAHGCEFNGLASRIVADDSSGGLDNMPL